MPGISWRTAHLCAALILLGLLAACGRPLASGERAFAADLFGDGLNVDRVRIAAGLRLGAPPRTAPPPAGGGKLTPRPGFCDRNAPAGPRTGPPPAIALYQTIHLIRPLYRDDTAPGWPNRILMPHALMMAHELAHVWQWQNRARTGYRPLLAALESLLNIDPYFYDPKGDSVFLSYGYEQQAALIEDYLCYALFDPDSPRRAKVRAILAPVLPVARLDAALAR